jgi:ADP-ribose pyrophosphatase YjhB (NUDIX family)
MTARAEQIALWADRLRDISAMGLRFAKNVHDQDAFRAVQTIAMEMMALAIGASVEQMEPLRAPVFSRPTPFSTGDAAVIDHAGRILLVQRADNAQWAMPGGALEVGETPAEGVVREALEETGVRCRAVSLIGVFDSRLCGTQSRHHLYQFTFLCEPLNAGARQPPSHALEVLDVGWFAEDGLPEAMDPGHVSRIPEAFRVWRGDDQAFFDGNGAI